MKKGVVLIGSLIVLSSTTLVACGINKPQKVESSAENKEETKSNVETKSNADSKGNSKVFKIKEVAQLGDFTIVVNGIKRDSEGDGEYKKLSDDKEYLRINFTLQNISDYEKYTSFYMFKVVDLDGRVYEMAMTKENMALWRDLGPGRKMTGEYVVEIPKRKKGLELEFKSDSFKNGQVIIKLV